MGNETKTEGSASFLTSLRERIAAFGRLRALVAAVVIFVVSGVVGVVVNIEVVAVLLLIPMMAAATIIIVSGADMISPALFDRVIDKAATLDPMRRLIVGGVLALGGVTALAFATTVVPDIFIAPWIAPILLLAFEVGKPTPSDQHDNRDAHDMMGEFWSAFAGKGEDDNKEVGGEEYDDDGDDFDYDRFEDGQ